MALIKITLPSDKVVSESAKADTYRVGRVSGTNRLLVDSGSKVAVSVCIKNARKAQKMAVSAIGDRIKADGLMAKLKKEQNADRKKKMRDQVKALKVKASGNAKAAKELLRAGAAAMKAAGLSGLSSPLSSSDISLTSEPARSLKKVSAAKVDELKISGRKGTMKPAFAKLSAVKAPAKTKKAPKDAKAPAKAATKAKAPAKTAAKAKAPAKKVRGTSSKDTAEKIDKELPGILTKAGFKFNVKRSAGLVRNLKGGKVMKSNEGLAKMRALLAKKFDVKDKPDGFEIPGLLEVSTGPTGVVIVRPDRYVKSQDPSVRVTK